MKRAVLILVSGDPSKSARPVEAVRVAAGLSVHERLAVTLCLGGESARVLNDDCGDCVDGEHVPEFLEILKSSGARVLAVGLRFFPDPVGVQTVTEQELQREMSAADRIVRF